MITVWVGSLSEHKLDAVLRAFRKFGMSVRVCGYPAESGVNNQPYGLHETTVGARNRALEAQYAHNHEICFGIEGGILDSGPLGIFIESAVVVMATPDGQLFTGLSQGIQLPTAVCQEAMRDRSHATTVGKLLAQQNRGSKHDDPHSLLTNGLLTRTDCLETGVVSVILQAKSAGIKFE